MPEFNSKTHDLIDNDTIVRKKGLPKPTSAAEALLEDREILTELFRYVENVIIEDYDFIKVPLSERVDDNTSKVDSATFLASSDWQTAEKMLIIAQNAAGSQIGIFSRSICLEQGLSKGSMLPYIERAKKEGYAVIILRPNTNSMIVNNNNKEVKIALENSQTPEIHATNAFQIIDERAEGLKHLALLAYGNGACLIKDMFIRDTLYTPRVNAFVTIEASYIIENDDPPDVKQGIKNLALNFECNSAPAAYKLIYREKKLGCLSLSVGLPEGSTEVLNVAASTALALEPVFLYLQTTTEISNNDNITTTTPPSLPSSSSSTTTTISNKQNDLIDMVSKKYAQSKGIPNTTDIRVLVDKNAVSNNNNNDNESSSPSSSTGPVSKNKANKGKRGSVFDWIFSRQSSANGNNDDDEKDGRNLAVDDFDLLKVIGKGAFGKVLLVRRKDGPNMGQVYAMKVLKKSVVAAKDQVEHTKSERQILSEIRHPFLVQLRYAFQTDEKLYLIMDYYNGGSLFFHLRRQKKFNHERTRFYAAEILMALTHMHNNDIIYRDLKLENILMHSSGHIALTDFGLSKQGVQEGAGAQTFCGTAEYIAPDLFLDKDNSDSTAAYGSEADWWSFGILIYEMLKGKTPFVNTSRTVMFFHIRHQDPSYPSFFDESAIKLISGLLRKDKNKRLGSKLVGGPEAIKNHEFFKDVDFDGLINKTTTPPYVPHLENEFDLRYIPRNFKEQAVQDSISEKKKGNLLGGKNKKKDENMNFEGFAYRASFTS